MSFIYYILLIEYSYYFTIARHHIAKHYLFVIYFKKFSLSCSVITEKSRYLIVMSKRKLMFDKLQISNLSHVIRNSKANDIFTFVSLLKLEKCGMERYKGNSIKMCSTSRFYCVTESIRSGVTYANNLYA